MKNHTGTSTRARQRNLCNLCFLWVVSLGTLALPHCALAQRLLADVKPFEAMVFVDTSDPVQLKSHIEQWLAVWANPPNVEAELEALNALFGSPINGQGYTPPAYVKKQLINRGLNYDHWECRRWAVNNLLSFVIVGGDPEPFIPIFRDALNDPHPEVREHAIMGLGTVMYVITKGGPVIGEEWDAATKKRIAERRDHLIDMIIDLVITKGLTDESESIVDQADSLLGTPGTPPRKVWLRSLDRILSKKAIRFVDYAKGAEILRSEWHRKIYKVKEPAPKAREGEVDPFGGGR